MDKEINIKSSTIEKGIEIAKEFLAKLVYPTVEEVGLLFSDNIRYLRYKNQINILLKAKKYVDTTGIKVKEIPIKILVPLLECASMEDESELQDKWATMLGNMADSETTYQNQVFPYILSQISLEEFNGLIYIKDEEIKHEKKVEDYYDLSGSSIINSVETRIELYDLIQDFNQSGVFTCKLENFEFSNLERLGLIRKMPPQINIDGRKIIEGMKAIEKDFDADKLNEISLKYNNDVDIGYRITGLGVRFTTLCESKGSKK